MVCRLCLVVCSLLCRCFSLLFIILVCLVFFKVVCLLIRVIFVCFSVVWLLLLGVVGFGV